MPKVKPTAADGPHNGHTSKGSAKGMRRGERSSTSTKCIPDTSVNSTRKGRMKGERLKVQTEGALTAYPWHRAKQERENHNSHDEVPHQGTGNLSQIGVVKREHQSQRNNFKVSGRRKNSYLTQNIQLPDFWYKT